MEKENGGAWVSTQVSTYLGLNRAWIVSDFINCRTLHQKHQEFTKLIDQYKQRAKAASMENAKLKEWLVKKTQQRKLQLQEIEQRKNSPAFQNALFKPVTSPPVTRRTLQTKPSNAGYDFDVNKANAKPSNGFATPAFKGLTTPHPYLVNSTRKFAF